MQILIPDYLKNKRLRRGDLGSVEQDEFCDIIISFVILAGGAIRRQKILQLIHETFSAQFSDADYALLESQKPPKERWIHNIDWAKRKLVQQGILLPPLGLPTGTWKLSEQGKIKADKLIKANKTLNQAIQPIATLRLISSFSKNDLTDMHI